MPQLQLGEQELLLMTARGHDQFNTTIYGLSDRCRSISHGRRVIFLNASDVQRLGLTPGQWVDISHHRGDSTRGAFMFVASEIPTGCAATYFPETNVLVPASSVVEGSNTPTYKTIVITLHPSG